MRRHSLSRTLALAVALALPVAAHAQVDGARFDYYVDRHVEGVSGAYTGWNDHLVATGRYTVSAPAGEVTIHATYTWSYGSPESSDHGDEDRTVRVGRDARRYLGEQTDLDDYDDERASQLETWVWIPTSVAPGGIVNILGETFRVVDVAESAIVAGAPRTTVHVQAEGVGTRDDAYGRFTTRWQDDYWFDATTGMFLREHRTEDDSGTSGGQPGSFRETEDVVVTDATYAPHEGPPARIPVVEARVRHGTTLPWAPFVGAGVVALAVLFVVRRLVRPRRPVLVGGHEVLATKLGEGAALDESARSVTTFFGAFLAHFVAVARRTNDDVWIVRLGERIAGIAIDDHATGVATIFAADSDVCEKLRRAVGRSDFFSEMRHGNLGSVIAATQATGAQLPSSAAYNVLDTYEVLELAGPGSPPYDTQVVARLDDAYVAAAADVLTRVLGTPCRAYLDAALACGDLAYVARAGGTIVGVGLATVAGTEGRLHTLAVDEAHRNRGLGRELVRARIRAMTALGATRIVTEIAARNSASLEIVRGEGFRTIGAMYVESARAMAPAQTTTAVRR